MKSKKLANKINLFLVLITVISLSVLTIVSARMIKLSKVAGIQSGFDKFGYNYNARIFQGLADGVDRNLDGKLWGDATYAKDHIVMKWSKAWDDARFRNGAWTAEAWEDNEWNGKAPGGSGEVWHYKIIWVGPLLENSPYWKEGGYAIWGEFEVIFSQGTVANEHFWETHASPAGYGVY